MRRSLASLLIGCLLVSAAYGQRTYRVVFKDKGPEAATYLANPASFLSAHALDRYAQQAIALTETDVPVSRTYIRAVQAAGGYVTGQSRWFNLVWVSASTPAQLKKLRALPCVADVVLSPRLLPAGTAHKADGTVAIASDTLLTTPQLRQLGVDGLHASGFTGRGIRLAVFDGGFTGVNSNDGFARLRAEGRLLAAYDVAENDCNVFDDHYHGTHVLACIVGELPGYYRGAAPEVSTYLLRTEVVASETHAEERNWLMAAEWADSAGAWIIQSSLGYSTFDDGEGDYTWAGLDGRTSLVTQAAEAAAARGILVVNSAGNTGDGSWRYITFPADGPSVLAVGALTNKSERADFSGQGPTADGRIKPDVMARGVSTVYIRTNGSVGAGNGTSYAAPLVAGLAACLWQAVPTASASDVRTAIRLSADRAEQPDTLYGFGLPNGPRALTHLQLLAGIEKGGALHLIRTYGNPAAGTLQLAVFSDRHRTGTLTLLDPTGKALLQRTDFQTVVLQTLDVSTLPNGAYILQWQSGEASATERILVAN